MEEHNVKKLRELTSNFFPKEDIKLILELGSRDGNEAISLSKEYPNSKVISFECNPETYPVLTRNISNHPRISAYQLAISDTDGIINFYQSKHGNPGSSSIFKKSGKYDNIENLFQIPIKVQSSRLDSFLKLNNIKDVDLIWADLQGAELKAFIGMGDYIKNVKVIYTEISYNEIYSDQCLYNELKSFLETNEFIEVHRKTVVDNWWGDSVFVNKNLIG